MFSGATTIRFVKAPARTAAVMLCTLVAACTDATGQSYIDGCKEAGQTQVAQRLQGVRSFFEATGDGCSFSCLEPLRANDVDFVEIGFDRASYERKIKTGELNKSFWTPPEDGLYKITLSKVGPCAKQIHSVLEGRSCILFERVTSLQSRYAYKVSRKTEYFRSGHASIQRYEVLDRESGSLIASKQTYSIYWLEFFVLPVQRSCGTGVSLQWHEVVEK